ncbi:hypothetical protein F10086_12 [Staphylococcus phage vB_SauM_JDF86]|nr:hypothetical protein F10086_12 [Staphylococcus phage vB_SauM_JDF86]
MRNLLNLQIIFYIVIGLLMMGLLYVPILLGIMK